MTANVSTPARILRTVAPVYALLFSFSFLYSFVFTNAYSNFPRATGAGIRKLAPTVNVSTSSKSLEPNVAKGPGRCIHAYLCTRRLNRRREPSSTTQRIQWNSRYDDLLIVRFGSRLDLLFLMTFALLSILFMGSPLLHVFMSDTGQGIISLLSSLYKIYYEKDRSLPGFSLILRGL